MKALTKNFVDALTIKQARERLNYGQLAEKTGVNSVTISRIINRKVDTAQEGSYVKKLDKNKCIKYFELRPLNTF
ncbi:helix-turn-helix transcriptional regulator [Fructobacillus sp. W13]|uniref:Helix-turn-helix transcriptional regulator n=1 Tax=Fructobacillus apis TaxID=2935017 RepID=A0ABT0ZRB9_9LACO|nr:helix-turn-helix transcriptional regulator [Fructobacillus apis]MCO0832517.1 helix-turn-helix transcriptional regulator [Fructobacillus apis]